MCVLTVKLSIPEFFYDSAEIKGPHRRISVISESVDVRQSKQVFSFGVQKL
jgi:hypothetical protein